MTPTQAQILAVFKDMLTNDPEEAHGMLDILKSELTQNAKRAGASHSNPDVTGVKVGDWIKIKDGASAYMPKKHWGKFFKIKKLADKHYYLYNPENLDKDLWPFFDDIKPLAEEDKSSAALRAAKEALARVNPGAMKGQVSQA